MSNSKYTDEYYKVSFVTTHSSSIPSMLKYTGSLIVMSDLSTKDPITNKNRMSIWLRGEHIASGWGLSSSYRMANATWWADSYNGIFGSTYGACEFDPNSSINKDYIDSPTYEVGTNKKPISLQNRFDCVYTYITDTKKDLIDTIEGNKGDVDANIAILNNKITYLGNWHTSDCNNIRAEIKETRESCYNYTDKKIKDLIGNAPDTLDTLGEIADWLNHAKSLGMDTVEAIMDIKSTYITHDEPDANGFTYLSTYSYTMKMDKDNPHTGHVYSYNTQTGEWEETADTYTYYDYVIDKTYTNAMKSTQISTPFEDHKLSDILWRLITPYPYTTPTITLKSIDNIDVETWQEEVVPVGTQYTNMKGVCNIDLKDSSELSNITINNVSNQVFNCTDIVNTPTTDYIINMGDFTSLEAGTFVVFKESTNVYGDAVHQEYPQLKGIEGTPVYDEEHLYKGDTETKELANIEITKTFKYTFYTKTSTGTDDLISDATKIGDYGTLCYVEGNIEEGTCHTNILNPNKDGIRCTLMLPTSILSNTNTKIYITDTTTHIKELVYADGKLNKAFTSDIMSTDSAKLENVWLQQEYSYVTIFTYRYPFANSFTFDIEW